MENKLNVLCYISCAGPNVLYENVEETITSIEKNINTNFKFFIHTDSEDHKIEINNIFKKLKLTQNLINIEVLNESWAFCFNKFYSEYKNESEYILFSHDDLIIRTFDFFNIAMNEISGFEDEIGWIGFTSDSYYRIGGIAVQQSAREIFCKDRNTWPRTFELHKMNNGYEESLLDMPLRACKVPGIFPHLMLIKSTNLEKIGLCPELGHYTILIDEHWSLQTLVKNMWTIWVPSVFYDHPIRGDQRRVQGLVNAEKAEVEFKKIWGFNYQIPLTDQIIKEVCDRFPNTNINFFNDKNTFDYQYLK